MVTLFPRAPYPVHDPKRDYRADHNTQDNEENLHWGTFYERA